MKLFVFGSSLTSSYWNGAATYYRGIYKNLARLGYEISFAEPDIYKRQQNRDAGEIDYAEVRVYQTPRDLDRMLAEASGADLIIKHSGVGADDELLEREVLNCRPGGGKAAFWDVDAPATLARVEENRADPFRPLIAKYDFIFTYGGGLPVVEHYLRLGARNCVPIYNGLDPGYAPSGSGGCGVRLRSCFRGTSFARPGRAGGGVLLRGGGNGAGVLIHSGRRGLGRASAAAECAMDRACGHCRSQPHQLFGAHGVEHQPAIHGKGGFFSTYPGI